MTSPTLERLATAIASDDLSFDILVRNDRDWVHALGAVGNRNPDASSLIHAELAGSLTDLKAARRAAINITRKISEKRGWKLTVPEIINVGDSAVKMWMSPVCGKCHGQKYRLIPGTPHLGKQHCPRCAGTGLQPYPLRHGRKISEVVHAMTTIRDVAETAVRMKMRGL